MRPLVAVSTEAVERAGRHERPMATLYGAYLSCVQDAGLTPVPITPLHDEAAIRQIVSSCAGLVLTGGEDVDPRRYGEEPIPDRCFVTPARDAMEWAALEVALSRRLPVLAICRGIQVLNVFFGGSLWQDLPSQRPQADVHEQGAPWGESWHEIDVKPGSRLHAILGAGRVRVNSWHHQAVRDLAAGLEITATTADGVIEGVEAAGPDFVVGVQWHPERVPAGAAADHPDRRLFRAFADAVAARTAEAAA